MILTNILKNGCGWLLAAVLLAGIIGATVVYGLKPNWHEEYGQRFLDITYGSRQHNTYDLYLPYNAVENDSLALILFIHGGSWLGGDKADLHDDCYKWVQRGYSTASMNYSLLSEEGVSLLTMYDEIDCCIRHIISFASEKGVHICQMAIAGTSAGGHLAMMYAYHHSHPIPLRFEAIKVGPADFRILFPYNKKTRAKDVESTVFSCAGKRMKASDCSRELLDRIKLQASPICYINDSTALPAIFAYGGKDWLIRPAHYHALQAKYDSLGKSYDLIVFPNSSHDLMQDKDCTERYDSILNSYCKKYFGY